MDRSFIRNLPQNPEDRAITEVIIARARTLSLTVVAEGVETVEQEAFLREHACDESQGFYFSKPVAADRFADLLRDHIATPRRDDDGVSLPTGADRPTKQLPRRRQPEPFNLVVSEFSVNSQLSEWQNPTNKALQSDNNVKNNIVTRKP